MVRKTGYERFFLESPGSEDRMLDITSTLSSHGDWKETEGTETVIRRIITNLFIPRGTYAFDPEYGADIYKYIFEQADNVTYARISEEVRRVVDQNKEDVDVTFEVLFFKNRKGFRINIIVNTENGKVKKVPVDIDETLLRVE